MSSMDSFKEKYNIIVIRDAYLNYDVTYFQDSGFIAVYCQTCEECVCTFSYERIKHLSPTKFYEEIIDNHREIQ